MAENTPTMHPFPEHLMLMLVSRFAVDCKHICEECRDVLDDIDYNTLADDVLKYADGRFRRLVHKAKAESLSAGLPDVPAIVSILEYDKIGGECVLMGQYHVDMTPALQKFDPSDLEDEAVSTTDIMYELHDCAIIDWDGDEFELEYDEDDMAAYVDARKKALAQ